MSSTYDEALARSRPLIVTWCAPFPLPSPLPSASLLATNPILQGITATSPKPSFLLWEKAQRRAASAEEEVWLLRGLQAFVVRFDDKLAKDEALR